MINYIPVALLSKRGNYEIEIHGAKVKVSVVEIPAMIDAKIEELKSSLQSLQRRVVGLDIKFVKYTSEKPCTPKILLLCVEARCLIIQIRHSGDFPKSFWQFLSK
jgi:hypothetical protein